MEINDLKKTKVVTKEGHFMPLVFVDIVIGKAILAPAAILVGRQLDQQMKDNKKRFSNLSNIRLEQLYTPISTDVTNLSTLALSIEDISY